MSYKEIIKLGLVGGVVCYATDFTLRVITGTITGVLDGLKKEKFISDAEYRRTLLSENPRLYYRLATKYRHYV